MRCMQHNTRPRGPLYTKIPARLAAERGFDDPYDQIIAEGLIICSDLRCERSYEEEERT
jgi:hypothetical protein